MLFSRRTNTALPALTACYATRLAPCTRRGPDTCDAPSVQHRGQNPPSILFSFSMLSHNPVMLSSDTFPMLSCLLSSYPIFQYPYTLHSSNPQIPFPVPLYIHTHPELTMSTARAPGRVLLLPPNVLPLNFRNPPPPTPPHHLANLHLEPSRDQARGGREGGRVCHPICLLERYAESGIEIASVPGTAVVCPVLRCCACPVQRWRMPGTGLAHARR